MSDLIHHPAHYTAHPILPGESWDYAGEMMFDRGSAFKYAWRCLDKGNPVQDLQKCGVYLDREARALWVAHKSAARLHLRLKHHVQASEALTAYYRSMSEQGQDLDSDVPGHLPEGQERAYVREVMQAETALVCVAILHGDQDMARASVKRALALAPLL